jgi:hypothetical protein
VLTLDQKIEAEVRRSAKAIFWHPTEHDLLIVKNLLYRGANLALEHVKEIQLEKERKEREGN